MTPRADSRHEHTVQHSPRDSRVAGIPSRTARGHPCRAEPLGIVLLVLGISPSTSSNPPTAIPTAGAQLVWGVGIWGCCSLRSFVAGLVAIVRRPRAVLDGRSWPPLSAFLPVVLLLLGNRTGKVLTLLRLLLRWGGVCDDHDAHRARVGFWGDRWSASSWHRSRHRADVSRTGRHRSSRLPTCPWPALRRRRPRRPRCPTWSSTPRWRASASCSSSASC